MRVQHACTLVTYGERDIEFLRNLVVLRHLEDFGLVYAFWKLCCTDQNDQIDYISHGKTEVLSMQRATLRVCGPRFEGGKL